MLRDDFPAIVEALTTHTPVSLSRWGDGEWHAILGHKGQNCDGQLYTAQLREALTAVLMDRPTYRLAMQPFALRRMGPEVQAWLDARGLVFDWIDSDVLANRSMKGTLGPFLAALSTRRVLLVGPEHLAPLRLNFLAIPPRGAFAAWRGILERVKYRIEGGVEVVLLSAGMASNLLVHELSKSHPEVSVLDCGSLWEPYVGKITRTYHKAIVTRERALV